MENKCILIGSGSLLESCIGILLNKSFVITGVVSNDPQIILYCQQNNIIIYNNINQALIEPVDYLFSINNTFIIPDKYLNQIRHLSINYHDSLLPKYAGSNTTAWALLGNEKLYGITWHEMVKKVDAGDILLQKEVEILPDDTTFSLNLKCFEAAINTFPILCDLLLSNKILPKFQVISKYKYFLSEEKPSLNAIIQLDQSVEEILRLVRAMNYGQYDNPLALAKIEINNRVYSVKKAGQYYDNKDKLVGQFDESDNEFFISVKDGIVKLSKLNPISTRKSEALYLESLIKKDITEDVSKYSNSELLEIERLNKFSGKSENNIKSRFKRYNTSNALKKSYFKKNQLTMQILKDSP